MSVTGIASSILAGLGGAQGSTNKSQQIQSEFSSLAQDLQTGNLQKAQTDFTALAKNLPGLSQSGSQANNTTANSQTTALNINQIIGQLVGQTISQSLGQTPVQSVGQTGSTTAASPLLQAFNQLGQDLQSGNLQGAKQDLTTIQQATQPTSSAAASAAQTGTQQTGRFHHHHHRAEGAGDNDQVSSSSSTSSTSSSSSSTSASKQPISLEQAFKSLAQDLQSGNLHGAQQAFSALQTDLQQIGGIVTGAAATTVSASAAASKASLNVSA